MELLVAGLFRTLDQLIFIAFLMALGRVVELHDLLFSGALGGSQWIQRQQFTIMESAICF